MAKNVCIQAGHLNIGSNSIVALRGATGAPGEMAFNDDIVNRLVTIFKTIPDIKITKTDANANDTDAIVTKDWDLFLSVHYDADIYNDTGGFTDFPEPDTDFATAESQRIAEVIGSTFFSETSIKRVQRRSNINTRYYYMWRYLSEKTPCVLIECGVGWRKPNDYAMLNTEDGRAEVANALAKSICKAFGVSFQEPIDPDLMQDIIKKAGYYAEIRKMIGVAEDKFSKVTERLVGLLKKETDYNNRVEQVRRLEAQMALLETQIKALETMQGDNVEAIKGLNEVIAQLHISIDTLGKEKGALNDQIQTLNDQLIICEKGSVECSRSCIQTLIDILTNFLKGGAK